MRRQASASCRCRSRATQGVAGGGEVRAGEQQKAGEEGPHHQADGDIEGTVDGVEVEPRQGEDVEDLRELPQQADDDGGGQNGAGREPCGWAAPSR